MRLEVRVDTGDARKAKAVAFALADDARPKRGSAKFAAKGTKLCISIEAHDNVAMRAAVNSSLRIADACLSVLGVSNG